MAEIEARINEVLLDDLPVTADVMALDAARRMGAMALFGEKYGERVRVVSIGDWSRELCVGTHTPRRTDRRRQASRRGIHRLGRSPCRGARRRGRLRSSRARGGDRQPADRDAQRAARRAADRIAGLLTKLKDAEREIAAVKQGQVLGAAPGLVASARDLGVTFVSHDAGSDVRAEDLRALVLDVRSRLGGDRPVVVSMAAVAGGRPFVIVATNERARGEGIKAAYVRVAAQVLGGGGGGKDDIAQGGGSDPSRSRTRSARSRTSFAPGAHEPGRRTSHPTWPGTGAGRRRRGQRPRRRRRLGSLGVLAHPVRTLGRDAATDADLHEIVALTSEIGAVEVVVGLPRHLSGEEGEAADCPLLCRPAGRADARGVGPARRRGA